MRWNAVSFGLLFGAAAWVVLALPAIDSAMSLHGARALHAIAEARATAPVPKPSSIVASGLTVEGGSDAAAATTMDARVRKLAARGGVLVEAATRTDPGAGLAGLRVRLSGPSNAVVTLVDTVERDAPLVRFAKWRVVALPGGGLRVDGELVGAWR